MLADLGDAERTELIRVLRALLAPPSEAGAS